MCCLGVRSLINQPFPGLDLSFESSKANSPGTPGPGIDVKAWSGGAELQGEAEADLGKEERASKEVT